ncbi:MAG: hypothetical protein JEZ10_00265 [Verrucomicrobia bacterium]|nr:hypothetical protein [Verrucomicrobiota bacterium]
MKKSIVWLITVASAFARFASAEVVITSPTGLPDESDVVLESVVDAVKDLPADTVKVVADVMGYTSDELRNTAYGIQSAFAGDLQEATRDEMLQTVTDGWDNSGDILFRSYRVSPAISKAMEIDGVQRGAFLDVTPFFSGVDFPKGASADFQSAYGQLLVRNTPSNLAQVESILATYAKGEQDFEQVEINAKFIEVSQSTLNQLGFTWDIQDIGDGARLFDTDWMVNPNQDVFGAGIRTAAAAFGGAPAVGSMVLTKTGWMPLTLAIDALEQAGDSDVLSAPSLTTTDGKKAEIWVGEDRMVPKGFQTKSSEVNIHVEHSDWNSELMGVQFSVTPKIQENNLIRLDLNPKIIDLIGYDTYQLSPNASMMVYNGYGANTIRPQGRFPIFNTSSVNGLWNLAQESLSPFLGDNNDPNDSSDTVPADNYRSPQYGYYSQSAPIHHDELGIPLPSINGQLPYFRVREIKTKVAVADGSTVGLGGLIYDRLETYKDKVPVLGSIPLLGRLFRSEGEKSIKRNLMIFVSATQLNNNGQSRSAAALNN